MLKLFNTLSRKKEGFKPLKKKVKLFVCGLTPYDYAHIGHAKTYVQFDVIVKYLRYLKYDVFYLQNVTNIDDKIITRAKEVKKEPLELSRFFERAYLDDMEKLKVDSVNKYARATDYIKEIISQIERLIEKGYAYETSDGVYYSIEKFEEYGKLSKQPLEKIKKGARVNVNENKKDASDFVLWKKEKPGEPSWASKFGRGRPGWHIEDTAITEKELGVQYDIHGGAQDLIFPHHEAEIAQMEAISKKQLVKYWLHTAFLNINKEKMSKSLSNFITIKDVLDKYDGRVVRYFFVVNHYRTPVDFSFELLEQAKNSLSRIDNFVLNLTGKDHDSLIEKYRKRFVKEMNDDFNTPKAMAVLFDFIKEVNKKSGGEKTYNFIKEIDSVFNILEEKVILFLRK